RGIALHKMIRLVTASTMNGGYLNFMGNEFGHPEWIDFPREGNGWSCKYARRQWSLIDNSQLAYDWLGTFDRDMLEMLSSARGFLKTDVTEYWHNDSDQVLAFGRGDKVFVFNFSPDRSYSDYGILVPQGRYRTVLDSDSIKYGGYGRPDDGIEHSTLADLQYRKCRKGWLMLYLPSRTALVMEKIKI
ncbi:MAG: alpha amylase C-terminal domain-containing protein, partial [Bacteroidaceae bacterium]|nr:alpha amylase C-terminal domain-containing protein [Bacteroidaceae bacterium]